MKNQISTKMEKMISTQFNSILINAVSAMCWSVYVVYFEYDDQLSFLTLVTTVILAFVVNKILNFICEPIIQWIYYRGNNEEFKNDVLKAAEVISLKINESVNPQNSDVQLLVQDVSPLHLGTFLGENIPEWVDFSAPDGSNPFRAVFEGTVDLEKVHNFTVPANCILLPPGLIFKIEQPAQD